MENFDVPVTVYRGKETRVVHSQKQHDDASAEGFGPYVHQEYPRFLYGDHGENVVAHNEAQEKEYAGKGFNRVVTAKPPAPVPVTPVPPGQVGGNPLEARVIALEVQAANLKERVDSIQGAHYPVPAVTDLTEDTPVNSVEEYAKRKHR